MQKIQKVFVKTLCNSFEDGGLKNIDINSKVASLQCSWIKQLLDDKFDKFRLIPIHLIKSNLG